jgi:hypothetical protein
LLLQDGRKQSQSTKKKLKALKKSLGIGKHACPALGTSKSRTITDTRTTTTTTTTTATIVNCFLGTYTDGLDADVLSTLNRRERESLDIQHAFLEVACVILLVVCS